MIGSPGGELSPQVTEGWFPTQSLIISRPAIRRPGGLAALLRNLPAKEQRDVEDAVPYCGARGHRTFFISAPARFRRGQVTPPYRVCVG